MKYEKGEQEVVVRIAVDPGGDLAVLLQLPSGWIMLNTENARKIAMMLTLTAEELEEAQ